jgi:hypothetical protein
VVIEARSVPDDPLKELLDKQFAVVSRAQALAAGVTGKVIARHLRANRWRRIVPGVYATFSGPVFPMRAGRHGAARR